MAENEESGLDRQDFVIDRKRSRSLEDSPEAKRSNLSRHEEQVSVLIPSSVIGSVIGNGGEEIRALQSESKCRVKISGEREFFQDTSERICTVNGEIPGMMLVMKTILEKIHQNVDPYITKDVFDLRGFERKNEMKFVIPHLSAGTVIGQSGSSITELRESTNAHIRVSSAGAPGRQISERVITVGAERNDFILNAMQKIIEKLSTDPIYERESKKLAGALRHPRFSNSSNHHDQGRRSSGVYNFGGGSLTRQNDNSVLGMNGNTVESFLGNLHTTLRASGFNEISVQRTMGAMEELIRFNTMGLVLNLGSQVMAQFNTTTARSTKIYERPPQGNHPRTISGTTVTSGFSEPTDNRGRHDPVYGDSYGF